MKPLLISKFEPSARSHKRGFTLLEIVIVLALLTLLLAATIPSFRGLKEEQTAREPITALARLAKETRLRALREKRPYQIAFTAQGFTATRYLSPYLQMAQLEEFVLKSQRQEEEEPAELTQERQPSSFAGQRPEEQPAIVFHEWTERYQLPPNITYSLQYWYEASPTVIGGDLVKLWVFQPSGMQQPLTVKLQSENATFEATFNALTADILKEKADFR